MWSVVAMFFVASRVLWDEVTNNHIQPILNLSCPSPRYVAKQSWRADDYYYSKLVPHYVPHIWDFMADWTTLSTIGKNIFFKKTKKLTHLNKLPLNLQVRYQNQVLWYSCFLLNVSLFPKTHRGQLPGNRKKLQWRLISSYMSGPNSYTKVCLQNSRVELLKIKSIS